MGLDGVELVMDCEDEFGITISDADATATTTPGQLTSLVIRLMHRDGVHPAAVCPSAKLFYALRSQLMTEGVPKQLIHPRARLREIFLTHRSIWISRYTLLTHLGVRIKNKKQLLRDDIPTQTLADLIRASTSNSTPFDTNAEELMVWLRVRMIVAEQLGRSIMDVTPDVDFVKDLGMY